jgi:uridine kinase
MSLSLKEHKHIAMDREHLQNALVTAILGRKVEGRPLRVAIDGRSAAGKTRLAAELAALIDARGLQVLNPSIDGFHHPRERRYPLGEFSAQGYFEHAFNYAAVLDDLLRPISGDVFPVHCRQMAVDLFTDLPSYPPTINVGGQAIMLFEGIFALRRELEPYWDFKILLDVDPPTALSRAFVRNSTLAPDIVQLRHERRYEPAWQFYLEKDPPEPKADVIVDNRCISNPVLLKPTDDEAIQ